MKKLIMLTVALCVSVQMFGLTSEQITRLEDLKKGADELIDKYDQLVHKALEERNMSDKRLALAGLNRNAKISNEIEKMLDMPGIHYTDKEFSAKLQEIMKQ